MSERTRKKSITPAMRKMKGFDSMKAYGLINKQVVGPFDYDPMDLDTLKKYETTLGAAWRRQVGELIGTDPWTVAMDQIGENEVSTVFLGWDHNWSEEGPPILFETMVFPESNICVRSSTWEEAETVHAECVAELRGAND